MESKVHMSHRRRSAAACNTFAKDTRIRSFALVQPLVMTIAALSTDQHDLQQQYTPLITPRLLPERSRVIPRTSNSSSCFSYRTSTCETKCSSSSAVVAYTRGYTRYIEGGLLATACVVRFIISRRKIGNSNYS